MPTLAADRAGQLADAFAASAETAPWVPHPRSEAALLALGRRCNDRQSRAELMQAAADLLAGRLAADFSGVGEPAPDRSAVNLRLTVRTNGGAAGEPLRHADPWDPQNSLSGYALREAAPVVSEDLAQENRFADPFLLGQGVHGALAIPLLAGGEPCGIVSAYSLHAWSIVAGDLQFAETLALMLSSRLAQSLAEEQLRRERRFSQAVFGTIDALILVLDPQGRVEQTNSFAVQLSGFTDAEVRGKSLASVFLQPRDEPRFQQCLRNCVREKAAGSMECELLAKNGRRRHILWSLQALDDDEGAVRAVVMTGIDRTADREKTGQIERLRSVAEEAARVMRKGGLPEESTRRLRSLLAKAPLADESDDLPAPARPEPRREQPLASPNHLNQRRHARRSYRCPQKIAPLRGAAPPSPEEFFDVLCEDLSAGGFSFYLECEPDFSQVVVALGQSPEITYFTAQVVRHMPKKLQGRPMILVGCRFSGRIQL
jgi:PAS domain S-box-containing protein